MISEASSTPRIRNIPRSIWALGFVSMFMDISSEMIHALLPIYLVTVLGASMITVGFIEGIAEAATMIVKIFQVRLAIGSEDGRPSRHSAMVSPPSPSRSFHWLLP